MNYNNIYVQLIHKRKVEQPITRDDCYVEKHHIIPRSEGGEDIEDNLVNLSAREHYIAHLLLARIYDDHKMWCAIWKMMYGNNGQNTVYVTSRMYDLVRINRSMKLSISMSGRNNGMYGKSTLDFMTEDEIKIWRQHITESSKGRRWFNNGVEQVFQFECPEGFKPGMIKGRKCTEEHNTKISKALKGRSNTWCIGTHWWNNGIVTVKSRECPEGFKPGRLK